MMWTDESGERLQSMASRQTTLSDDTYERFEKISVSANHGREQTFVCIATGDSVNGTSTTEITILPKGIISGNRANVCLIVGLRIGILAAAVFILLFLVGKFRQKCGQDYVPQGVSEESPPIVQRTIGSEDESRKWYSVQWADLKLCCRQLKDVSSKHPLYPFYLYAFYRFGLAAYFSAFFIISVIFKEEEQGPKFVIYLPFWTYTSTACYVYLACFNAVMDRKKSRTNAAFEDECRYQIQWLLYNCIATPSIIVTLFYLDSLDNLTIFILPSVICLLEIFYTRIIVRFVHVVYPFLYLTIYLLFVATYFAAGGTDPCGNRSVSPLLNFEHAPGVGTATVVGISLATLLIQAMLKGLYVIRVRCMETRKTEAVPPTEAVYPTEAVSPTQEPVAVELEALTG
ncbi:uncharacterized protein [Diadema setosum]|uniref:uncharacterized protein n=1 Tax=Diadema setosum TaxID=31175 RepID=UPI003B3A8D30